MKDPIDVGLAQFYKLQAEVALQQTIRANKVVLWSVLVSWVMTVAMILMHAGIAFWIWGFICGVITTYKVASLVWPKKYDNLNIAERRLELNKAELEVERVMRDAVREEETAR